MAGKEGQDQGALEFVTQNLFVKSTPSEEEFSTKVQGYEFSKPDESGSKVDYHGLLQSFRTSGFQATNVGLAVDQINQMVNTFLCSSSINHS
jgi:deoxyhypusine synthase